MPGVPAGTKRARAGAALVALLAAVVAQAQPRTFEVRIAEDGSPVEVDLGRDGRPGPRAPSDRMQEVDAHRITRAVLSSEARLTLLALYASWCRPCRHEMPEVATLARAYRPHGLDVLAFSLDDDPQSFAAYVRPFRGVFELVRVPKGDVGAELRTLGMQAGRTVGIPRFGLFDASHRLVADANRVAPLREAVASRLR